MSGFPTDETKYAPSGQSRQGWSYYRKWGVCAHAATPTTLHPDSDYLKEKAEPASDLDFFLREQAQALTGRSNLIGFSGSPATRRGDMLHAGFAQQMLIQRDGPDAGWATRTDAVMRYAAQKNLPPQEALDVLDYFAWVDDCPDAQFLKSLAVLHVEHEVSLTVRDPMWFAVGDKDDLSSYVWPYGMRKRTQDRSVSTTPVRNLFTSRIDLVCAADGLVYYPDYKSTGRAIHKFKMPVNYRADGQFVGLDTFGKREYGENWGGPLVMMLGVGAKKDFRMFPWTPGTGDIRYDPNALPRLINHVNRIVWSCVAEDYFPFAISNSQCVGRYGTCDEYKNCWGGSA